MTRDDEIMVYRAMLHWLKQKRKAIAVGDVENCRQYFKILDRLDDEFNAVMGWKE